MGAVLFVAGSLGLVWASGAEQVPADGVQAPASQQPQDSSAPVLESGWQVLKPRRDRLPQNRTASDNGWAS